MQAEQILGAECSQIHQDFVQGGRWIPGVTLLVAAPAPCTVVSLEGGSGTSCLPWFFQCKTFGSAVEPGSQKHLLQTLSLCFRQAHGLQAAAANQRSEFLHPTAWWNSLLQDATGTWRLGHISWWIGLFRAGSEVQWPGCKWGHLALQSWKLMDIMEEDCSVLPPCQSWLQLETGCSAMWILINPFVDFLLPYFIYPAHPANSVRLNNELKALAVLHSLIESVLKALWGLPLTPVGFGSDFKYMGPP